MYIDHTTPIETKVANIHQRPNTTNPDMTTCLFKITNNRRRARNNQSAIHINNAVIMPSGRIRSGHRHNVFQIITNRPIIRTSNNCFTSCCKTGSLQVSQFSPKLLFFNLPSGVDFFITTRCPDTSPIPCHAVQDVTGVFGCQRGRGYIPATQNLTSIFIRDRAWRSRATSRGASFRGGARPPDAPGARARAGL